MEFADLGEKVGSSIVAFKTGNGEKKKSKPQRQKPMMKDMATTSLQAADKVTCDAAQEFATRKSQP